MTSLLTSLIERFSDPPAKLTADLILPSISSEMATQCVLTGKPRLSIDPKIPGKTQLFIRTMTGKSFSILSSHQETVYETKLRIQEAQGTVSSAFRW